MSTGWGQRHSTANHVREGVGGGGATPTEGVRWVSSRIFFRYRGTSLCTEPISLLSLYRQHICTDSIS